jgi:hypothetical protein
MKYERAVLATLSKALHYGTSECIGVEPTERHMEGHDAADILFGSPHGRAIALVINEACRITASPSASRLDKLEGAVRRLATGEGPGGYLAYEEVVGKGTLDRDLTGD